MISHSGKSTQCKPGMCGRECAAESLLFLFPYVTIVFLGKVANWFLMARDMATTPFAFIKEVKLELFKVVWPTREQTIRLTAVVLVLSVTIGLFIGGLDIVLTKLTEVVLKR